MRSLSPWEWPQHRQTTAHTARLISDGAALSPVPRPPHGQPRSSDDPGRPIIAPRRQIMRPHSFQFMPTCAVHTALARAHGCTPGSRGLPVAWLPQRGRIAAPCTIHTRCTYREGEHMQGRAKKRILAMLAPSTLVWCSRSRSSPWQRLVKDAKKRPKARCKSYGERNGRRTAVRYFKTFCESRVVKASHCGSRSLVRHPTSWWCPGASCMPHVTLARRRMPPAVRARAFAA